jgi:hypothetical protein
METPRRGIQFGRRLDLQPPSRRHRGQVQMGEPHVLRSPVLAYVALAIVAIFVIVSTLTRMHDHRCRMIGSRLNCGGPAAVAPP